MIHYESRWIMATNQCRCILSDNNLHTEVPTDQYRGLEGTHVAVQSPTRLHVREIQGDPVLHVVCQVRAFCGYIPTALGVVDRSSTRGENIQ